MSMPTRKAITKSEPRDYIATERLKSSNLMLKIAFLSVTSKSQCSGKFCYVFPLHWRAIPLHFPLIL